MVLLVAIVLGGTITVLLARTVTGTRAARGDAAFTPVVHAADMGVQEASYRIMRDPDLAARPSGATLAGSGTSPEGDYTWGAVRCGGTPQPPRCAEENIDSSLAWVITSTAVEQNKTREVVAVVRDESNFRTALFSDLGVDLGSNNNTADSYPRPGFGVVGSNEGIVLNPGNSIDGVQLWNWGADPRPQRCPKSPVCTDALSGSPTPPSGRYDPPREPDSVENTQFIEDQLTACEAATPLQRLSYSDTNLPIPGGPQVICAESLYLDNVTFSAPVAFYVRGDVTFEKKTDVNCPGCNANSKPMSSNLQIYTLGDTVDYGNHGHIAAAIFAPSAECRGGAQTQTFGSLVCGSLFTNGGWGFHYDTRLGDLGRGGFEVTDWRENTAG